MKDQVRKFIKEQGKQVLPLDSVGNIEIKDKMEGSYNLNYPVRVDGKTFLFRICPTESEKRKQYEYKVLNLLKRRDIAPDPFYIDVSSQEIQLPFIIEQWIEGQPLSEISSEDMKQLANLFYQINSIEAKQLRDKRFRVKKFAHKISEKLKNYTDEKQYDLDLFYDLEELLPPLLDYFKEKEGLFKNEKYIGLANTDLKPRHVIRADFGFRIVDWEFAGCDDASHDIGEFFFHLNWHFPEFDQEKKKAFLKRYQELSQDQSLEEKVEVRMISFAITEAAWCMQQISSLRQGEVPESMQQGEDISEYRKLIRREFKWVNEKLNLKLDLK